MKKLIKISPILSVVAAFFSLVSCLNDDDNNTYYSNYSDGYVVTVVPEKGGSFYLVTDEGETLEPAKSYNFKPQKRQRAVAVFTVNDNESELYDYTIDIHRLDTFLTKPIAPNLGIENTEVYGNDPVSFHRCWIGDGYLNIWFSTYWGGKTHYINLLQTDEEENPYELEFRHNAYNDSKVQQAYSMVAFDLSSLPDTNGKTVNLRIKFREEGSGEKSFTIEYNTSLRNSTNTIVPQALFNESLKDRFIK